MKNVHAHHGLRTRFETATRLCHNEPVLGDADFILNGEIGELGRLASQTEAFCRAHDLGEDVLFELNLALEELFTNALRHGGCEGMREAVKVRLELSANGVLAEFWDRGHAFDLSNAPPPDLDASLAERPIGGLGIHLVRHFMRDLRYERAGDWNRVTMLRPRSL